MKRSKDEREGIIADKLATLLIQTETVCSFLKQNSGFKRFPKSLYQYYDEVINVELHSLFLILLVEC